MALAEEISDLNQADKIGLSVILLLLFTATAVVLIDSPEKRTSSDTESDQFNRNDLMFMNMMIIHHDQAIDMAELAPNRTDNENILEISRNISEAQRAENQKMAEWLREAGLNRPTRGHRMAGMATLQEMDELRQSEGREFDLLFSELMIEHHEGGIRMARAEVQNGHSEKVKGLAQGMVDVQQEEIDKMESWRNKWREE